MASPFRWIELEDGSGELLLEDGYHLLSEDTTGVALHFVTLEGPSQELLTLVGPS